MIGTIHRLEYGIIIFFSHQQQDLPFPYFESCACSLLKKNSGGFKVYVEIIELVTDSMKATVTFS